MRILKSILMVAMLAPVFMFTSCEKSDNKAAEAANKRYLGTYNGTDCSGNSVTDIVVSSGANNSQIYIPGVVGVDACLKDVNLVGNVSGNNVTFPTQTWTDLCGNSTTLSGAGTISGNTFSFTASGTSYLAGSSTPIAFSNCFTGSK